MPVEISLISQLTPFQNLEPALVNVIAQNAQAKRYPPSHTVLSHHTTPAYFVTVLRGQLQKTEVSEDGRVTGISFVNPGEVLDWLSAIDGGPIVCSVTTTVETDLLTLPISITRQLLRDSPFFSSQALQQLSLCVRRDTLQRQLLTLPNAFQRIFVQIVQLADQVDATGSQNLPKQHELAAMVNTSRETVSRAIQMLVKNGILVKHGHRFVLQRSDQLKQLAATGASGAVQQRKFEKS